MGKKILIFIFLVAFKYSNAQQYYPFPTENACWKNVQVYSDLGEEPDTTSLIYSIQGDTIYKGQTYHKLILTSDELKGFQGLGGIREVDKKIYFHLFSSGFIPLISDIPEEYLLYDFSKQKGDTIIHWLEDSHIYSRSIITEIDSVQINNAYRKRYTVVKDLVQNKKDFWIEGIGCVTSGLFDKIRLIPTGVGYDYRVFLCYKENNELLYLNPMYTSCDNITERIANNAYSNSVNLIIKKGQILINANDVPISSVSVITCYGNVFDRRENINAMSFSQKVDATGIFVCVITLQDGNKILKKVFVP